MKATSKERPSSRKDRDDRQPGSPSALPTIWIYLALVVATFAVYSEVRQFDFVDFDDPDYSGNPHVAGGLTRDGLVWAITSGEASNWFPVTRISHLIDAQLFGSDSGAQHLMSVLFHAITTLFVFAFLHRSTGARWPSALVAFLFALHPMHVESVAWIAERKDVLCGLFWFMTMWAYVRYVELPRAGRYALVLLTFALGLMSKPMIVTLPFVLLMLDVWPLRRRISWQRAFLEKLPLLAIAVAGAAIAYLTQRTAGSVEMVHPQLGLRVENALIAYVAYVWKTFWPTGLAVLYPYPVRIPLWEAALAGLILAAVSVAVLVWFRARPYLAFGWFWYLGTLIPVIGLVQVGVQARADRYTYIPMVGLLIMLAWTLQSAVQRWPRARNAIAGSVAAACALAMLVTSTQLQYWKNSESLFRRAVDATNGNYTMHYALGVVLEKSPARIPEAVTEYQAALLARPDYVEARTNLAGLFLNTPGRVGDAIAEYQKTLAIQPDSPATQRSMAAVHNNLGSAFLRESGHIEEAVSEYQKALAIKPDFTEARLNLGDALAQIPGRLPDAIAQYEEALRIGPDSPEIRKKLAAALSQVPGHLPDAIAQYREALRLNPASIEARSGLAEALLQTPGQLADAIAEYQAALRIKPDSAEIHNNLAGALSKDPARVAEAIEQYQAALAIRPDFVEAHYNLAIMLSAQPDKLPDAIHHLEAAERTAPGNLAVRQLLTRLRALPAAK